MRTAVVIFVGAHGLGHVIWFMATWARWSLGRSGRNELESHQAHFVVQPSSAPGMALGILALIVLVGFVGSAWGIWSEASWGPPLVMGSAIASIPVIVSMWNPLGTVSFNALIADIGLGAATIMPWGERLLGTP